QGRVTVDNSQLDDMILLRADGTPTYMLSVVLDDIDMGITHVIRGDDHLTNAFRQAQLYAALQAQIPVFAHIPLIHGPDGAKLSKRHGALGVEAYRDMGYLPETLRNYLLRLGWSHGDDEVISTEQAIAWFDLPAVGKSPARIDFDKLANLNGHYIREADDNRLVEMLWPLLEKSLGHPIDAAARARVLSGMPGLKQRAKTINDLADNALFYAASRPLAMTDKAAALLDGRARLLLEDLSTDLSGVDDWSEPSIEQAVRVFSERKDLKLGKVAQPLRAALSGSTTSPGIFEVAAILGKDEAIGRIADVTVCETT
ncbi:MAG: glutamate--tRNA ligase family protein, partial [Pseudomonadota bacterium]